jgi:hypothetical protein
MGLFLVVFGAALTLMAAATLHKALRAGGTFPGRWSFRPLGRERSIQYWMSVFVWVVFAGVGLYTILEGVEILVRS